MLQYDCRRMSSPCFLLSFSDWPSCPKVKANFNPLQVDLYLYLGTLSISFDFLVGLLRSYTKNLPELLGQHESNLQVDSYLHLGMISFMSVRCFVELS